MTTWRETISRIFSCLLNFVFELHLTKKSHSHWSCCHFYWKCIFHLPCSWNSHADHISIISMPILLMSASLCKIILQLLLKSTVIIVNEGVFNSIHTNDRYLTCVTYESYVISTNVFQSLVSPLKIYDCFNSSNRRLFQQHPIIFCLVESFFHIWE